MWNQHFPQRTLLLKWEYMAHPSATQLLQLCSKVYKFNHHSQSNNMPRKSMQFKIFNVTRMRQKRCLQHNHFLHSCQHYYDHDPPPAPPTIPNSEVLKVTQSLQLKWPADIVCWKVCLPGLCVNSKLWVWFPPCWQRFQFTSDETGSDHMFWNGNNIKTALSASTLRTPDQGLPLLENPFPETPSVVSPCKWTLEKRTTPLQKQFQRSLLSHFHANEPLKKASHLFKEIFRNPFHLIFMQMNLEEGLPLFKDRF